MNIDYRYPFFLPIQNSFLFSGAKTDLFFHLPISFQELLLPYLFVTWLRLIRMPCFLPPRHSDWLRNRHRIHTGPRRGNFSKSYHDTAIETSFFFRSYGHQGPFKIGTDKGHLCHNNANREQSRAERERREIHDDTIWVPGSRSKMLSWTFPITWPNKSLFLLKIIWAGFLVFQQPRLLTNIDILKVLIQISKLVPE